ncbi:SycD/LcrH family type III secretion system chaperone [Endozoicomonas euniceicola]|uniref:SycD/LcrH family type III secretion system chaperone n=1 Tax=Endozoicomonas euniceicola TaxID=1234143 RepID=A0ABY6GYB4_9GAMM|nr:SycD/LcrH family type III secretion system chaperone [Endozoicomonas euniceicola]UYM17789.1 SycD/LcrH family type III secretion system chaperone [Endozoicomonas euniceicola]
MPNKPIQATDEHQYANILTYLARGGSLAEANNISQSSLEAIYGTGYNQYTTGHYEEAARIFQYLCLYDQWNPRNYLCLGACQQMMHLYSQAIQTYTFAFRLDARTPLPLIYMADCQLALNQVEKAKEIYKTALKLAKSNSFDHKEINRAEVLLATIDGQNKEDH